MYNVSWNSHGKEKVEYENFLSELFIEDFIQKLKSKGYTEIKICEYDIKDGERVSVEKKYDDTFGDDKVCICGKTYLEHFDNNKDMEFCGCVELGCETFIEKQS